MRRKKNQKPTEQNQPLNAAGKEQSRTNRPAKSRQQLAETRKKTQESRSPTGRHYHHRPLCVSWPTAAHRRIRRACATHRCVWLPVVSMRDGLNMWIRRVQYLRTYLT